jgi:hypothetical protein
MTPIEKCKMLYTADSPRTFEEDMLAHLSHGCFFSTPEYVMMARPVCSAAPQEMINDVWVRFREEDCDAWYVYAFALRDDLGLQGLVKKLLRHIPYYLPLLAWERSGHPLTFFSTDKLIQKYALLQLVQD